MQPVLPGQHGQPGQPGLVGRESVAAAPAAGVLAVPIIVTVMTIVLTLVRIIVILGGWFRAVGGLEMGRQGAFVSLIAAVIALVQLVRRRFPTGLVALMITSVHAAVCAIMVMIVELFGYGATNIIVNAISVLAIFVLCLVGLLAASGRSATAQWRRPQPLSVGLTHGVCLYFVVLAVLFLVDLTLFLSIDISFQLYWFSYFWPDFLAAALAAAAYLVFGVAGLVAHVSRRPGGMVGAAAAAWTSLFIYTVFRLIYRGKDGYINYGGYDAYDAMESIRSFFVRDYDAYGRDVWEDFAWFNTAGDIIVLALILVLSLAAMSRSARSWAAGAQLSGVIPVPGGAAPYNAAGLNSPPVGAPSAAGGIGAVAQAGAPSADPGAPAAPVPGAGTGLGGLTVVGADGQTYTLVPTGQLAARGGGAPVASAPAALPPASITFWVSFFFGLFGLIPMLLANRTARSLGVVTNSYNYAFLKGWLLGALTGMLIFVTLLAVVLAVVTGM